MPLLSRGTFPRRGFARPPTNLRKRVASVAYVIKVRLTDIRYARGWSTNSTAMESKDVDFTTRPAKVTLMFFGHLKKDAHA